MNTCENLKPMAEWLKEPDIEGQPCKPCTVAALTGSYKEVLIENGRSDKANHIDSLLVPQEGQDLAMNVATAMDKIKEEVEEPIKYELLALDCMAQNQENESVKEASDV